MQIENSSFFVAGFSKISCGVVEGLLRDNGAKKVFATVSEEEVMEKILHNPCEYDLYIFYDNEDGAFIKGFKGVKLLNEIKNSETSIRDTKILIISGPQTLAKSGIGKANGILAFSKSLMKLVDVIENV